jgi:hypothetical protein
MQYTSLAVSGLTSWALINDVDLVSVVIEPDILDENGQSKGGGLIANGNTDEGGPLLTVPRDMIVSKEQAKEYARIDTNFRDLLQSLESSSLIQVSRPDMNSAAGLGKQVGQTTHVLMHWPPSDSARYHSGISSVSTYHCLTNYTNGRSKYTSDRLRQVLTQRHSPAHILLRQREGTSGRHVVV